MEASAATFANNAATASTVAICSPPRRRTGSPIRLLGFRSARSGARARTRTAAEPVSSVPFSSMATTDGMQGESSSITRSALLRLPPMIVALAEVKVVPTSTASRQLSVELRDAPFTGVPYRLCSDLVQSPTGSAGVAGTT